MKSEKILGIKYDIYKNKHNSEKQFFFQQQIKLLRHSILFFRRYWAKWDTLQMAPTLVSVYNTFIVPL